MFSQVSPDGLSLTIGFDFKANRIAADYEQVAADLIERMDRVHPPSQPRIPHRQAELLATLTCAFRWFGSGTLDGPSRITWERINTADGSAFVATIGPIPRGPLERGASRVG